MTDIKVTGGRRRIGFVTSALLPKERSTSSFDFFAVLTSEVLRSLQKEYDVIIRVPTPANRGDIATAQKDLLTELLNGPEDYHGLIISPADVEAIAKTLADPAREIRVPICTIDLSLNSSTFANNPNFVVPSSIEPDNFSGGRLAAECLIHYYNSMDNPPSSPIFLVVQGTGASQTRFEGFRQGISNKRGRTNWRPSVQSLEAGGYSYENGYAVINSKLETTPENWWSDVAGIFACNDELALGVCGALDAYAIQNIRKFRVGPMIHAAVVGFDGIQDVTRRIGIDTERWLINTVTVPISEMAKRLRPIVDNFFSTPRGNPVSKMEDCTLFKHTAQQAKAEELVRRRNLWQHSNKSRVDIFVQTIKPQEEEAILNRLGEHREYTCLHNTYRVNEITRKDGAKLTVASVGQIEQGVSHAQNTARDAIEDLDPRLIALVGICGTVPSRDYSLGDVIVCTRLDDYTVGKYIEDPRTGNKMTEVTNLGGGMEHYVNSIISALNGCRKDITWQSLEGISQPSVDFDRHDNFAGDGEYRQKLFESLHKRFGTDQPREKPEFFRARIASSGYLVKSTSVVDQWWKAAPIGGIEMELPGVYIAANRPNGRHYPVLAIRGISDIVGFKRSDEWTNYACEAAACFFFELLKVHPRLRPDRLPREWG